MKWTLFSDNLPPNLNWVQVRDTTTQPDNPYREITMRTVESKVPFSVYAIVNRAEINPKVYFVTAGNRQGIRTVGYEAHEIEWLDESGPPEGYERIDVKIGSYVMPPPTEYMKTPQPDYPTLEYVVLTEMHDDLIEKYETLLAKYNKLKNKK